MIVKIADKIKFILRSLSCITICTLVIVTGLQVVNRYVFHKSFTWVEELGGMAMVYITYFGAAMATINNSNTRIDFYISCPDLYARPLKFWMIVFVLDF